MRILLGLTASLVALILLVPIVLLVLPFWIVSACTQGLARLVEPTHLTRDQLIAFDLVFGWRPRRSLATQHLMGDLFRIVTDADGWRGRATLEASHIVAIGDSFAAGYGVGERDIFANITTRAVVKPVGIGGYSMVQELLWMRKLAPRLQDKLVVWFVYVGNDLYDNLSPELRGYRKPFVREARGGDGWEIVSSHVTAERWPIQARAGKAHVHMTTLAQLCAETYLATRAYAACEWLVTEAQRVCTAAGADLAVLTIPDSHQLSAEGCAFLRDLEPRLVGFDARRPEMMLSAICARAGVPHVTGSSFLDVGCYKDNDCHWNEAGHRRVAALLDRLHAERTAHRSHSTAGASGATVAQDVHAPTVSVSA